MACDGVADCSGGEDEDSCPGITCSVGSFLCRNGKAACLASGLQCDGIVDCPELNVSLCFFSSFSCLHEVKLLHSLLKCPVTVIVKFY